MKQELLLGVGILTTVGLLVYLDKKKMDAYAKRKSGK